MSHTYVVTSATAVGDNATIVGTVDDVPVTVYCSLALLNAQAAISFLQLKTFVASLMLPVAFPPPPPPVVNLPTGTFVL
jgi:hypothetical protein